MGFRYQPLDPAQQQIRVLQFEAPNADSLLNFHLRTVSLTDFADDYAPHHSTFEGRWRRFWDRDCLNTCKTEHESCNGIPIARWRAFPHDYTWEELAGDLQVKDSSVVEYVANLKFQDPPSRAMDAHRRSTVCFQPRFRWGDFEALSYCWGDSSRDATISLDGYDFKVTRNLDAALRRLHELPEFQNGMSLWCDAICIDQDNISERNYQVGLMRTIYAGAFGVLSWLGEEQEQSEKALEHMICLDFLRMHDRIVGETLTEQRRLSPDIEDLVKRFCWDSILDVLSREYWRRLWVIQELILNDKMSLVLCGSKQVTRPAVDNAAAILVNYSVSLSRIRKVSFTRAYNIREAKHVNTLLTGFLHYFTTLDFAQGSRCRDERDKVYGLLGLLPTNLASLIRPDYNISRRELFIRFAKAILAIEGITRLLSRTAGVENRGLPTWVPDLSAELPRFVPSILLRCYAGGRQPPAEDDDVVPFTVRNNGEILECTAIIIGTIEKVSTSWNEKEDTSMRDERPCSDDLDEVNSNRQTEQKVIHRTLMMTPRPIWPGSNVPEEWDADRRTPKNSLWSIPWTLSEHSRSQLSPILLEIVESPEWNAFESFRRRNSSFAPLRNGLPLKDLFTMDMSQATNEHIAGSNMMIATRNLGGRKLATVHGSGYPAMVPRAARPGDTIAALVNCNFPVVLRESGSSFKDRRAYEYVGECFHYEYVHGEAVVAVDQGRLKETDIVLI